MSSKRRYGKRKVRAKNAARFKAKNPMFQVYGLPGAAAPLSSGGAVVAAPNRQGQSIGFPANKKTTLRYADYYVSAVTTAGILVMYQYRANSLIDPDYTGVGHQPYTFDTWSTLYDTYMVEDAVITCQFQSAVNTVPCICGIYLSDDATVFTNWTTFKESGRASMGVLGGGLASPPLIVKAKFRRKTFFKGIVDNNSQSANVATVGGPTELAYFTVFVQPLDQATTVAAGAVTSYITIDYGAVFTEPKDLAAS